MQVKLDQKLARRIIEIVGANGIPPEYGLQYFTVGLDTYLNVLEEEYISSFIKEGGASFKLVVGIYGGGKTHFLYLVRDLAWKYNFATAYVELSQNECPFSKLEEVYKGIVRNITPPLSYEELLSGYERGINNFIKHWIGWKTNILRQSGIDVKEINSAILEEVNTWKDLESISFARALKNAVKTYLDREEDDFDYIIQWLLGESYESRIHKKFGILEKIDKGTAFIMIRSLVKWIKYLGYSGLIILFDEAEQIPSLSRKDKDRLLSNLRELIDECSHQNFSNVMIFYAVPDKHFLEGRTQIYEALRQRLETVFEEINPSGVEIDLEKNNINPIEFLVEVGKRLKDIYEIAYSHNMPPNLANEAINKFAEKALEERYGDIGYKRLFVTKLITAFHYIRSRNSFPLWDEVSGTIK